MSYFTNFSLISYPNFLDNSSEIILKDITSRVVRKISVLDDASLFYKYTIREGDSLESICENTYGNPNLSWVIMLINNRFDRFYDFPLTETQLAEYLKEKYGSISFVNNTFIKFIRIVEEDSRIVPSEDSDRFIEVESSFTVRGIDYTWDTYPVFSNGVLMKKELSLYEIEVINNEAKRDILLISRSYIDSFVTEFNRLIGE